MFCSQCGASNPDNAAMCGQCGKSLQAVPPPVPLPAGGVAAPPTPPVQIENYLVFAILTTVLCCLPAGIVAIVYAAQVNTKVQAGDIAGAKLASNNAKLWSMISAGVFLGLMAIYVVLMLVGVVAGLHSR